MALYDTENGVRELLDASARVINKEGCEVAWCDYDEWDDIAPVIDASDSVIIYDGERRVRELTGDEFKELCFLELTADI